MKVGAPYRISNVVVEFDEGRRIGWRHFGHHVWRYELEPVDGGTLVRETWDPTTERRVLQWVVGAAGDKTRDNMEKTLAKLEEVVTA